MSIFTTVIIIVNVKLIKIYQINPILRVHRVGVYCVLS